jgi:hypothetical protein
MQNWGNSTTPKKKSKIPPKKLVQKSKKAEFWHCSQWNTESHGISICAPAPLLKKKIDFQFNPFFAPFSMNIRFLTGK